MPFRGASQTEALKQMLDQGSAADLRQGKCSGSNSEISMSAHYPKLALLVRLSRQHHKCRQSRC